MRSGLVLDVYDDVHATIFRELFASAEQVPTLCKTAHLLDNLDADKVPDQAFGLVLVREDHKLRKFACHDPGNTLLSALYFQKTAYLLSPEARDVAAARIQEKIAAFGLTETLAKVATMSSEPTPDLSAGPSPKQAPSLPPVARDPAGSAAMSPLMKAANRTGEALRSGQIDLSDIRGGVRDVTTVGYRGFGTPEAGLLGTVPTLITHDHSLDSQQSLPPHPSYTRGLDRMVPVHGGGGTVNPDALVWENAASRLGFGGNVTRPQSSEMLPVTHVGERHMDIAVGDNLQQVLTRPAPEVRTTGVTLPGFNRTHYYAANDIDNQELAQRMHALDLRNTGADPMRSRAAKAMLGLQRADSLAGRAAAPQDATALAEHIAKRKAELLDKFDPESMKFEDMRHDVEAARYNMAQAAVPRNAASALGDMSPLGSGSSIQTGSGLNAAQRAASGSTRSNLAATADLRRQQIAEAVRPVVDAVGGARDRVQSALGAAAARVRGAAEPVLDSVGGALGRAATATREAGAPVVTAANNALHHEATPYVLGTAVPLALAGAAYGYHRHKQNQLASADEKTAGFLGNLASGAMSRVGRAVAKNPIGSAATAFTAATTASQIPDVAKQVRQNAQQAGAFGGQVMNAHAFKGIGTPS